MLIESAVDRVLALTRSTAPIIINSPESEVHGRIRMKRRIAAAFVASFVCLFARRKGRSVLITIHLTFHAQAA